MYGQYGRDETGVIIVYATMKYLNSFQSKDVYSAVVAVKDTDNLGRSGTFPALLFQPS